MRITTLNLESYDDWQKREPRIIDYLAQTRPDIILFQEVVFIPEISPYNQVSRLNQTLGFSQEHSSISRLQVGEKYETYREGLAFLTSLPVLKTEVIILKKAPLDAHNRIIQLFDVKVNDQIVKLANVHFSITDVTDFATAHLHETLDILAMRHEERIIMGDFNLDNLEDSAALWQNDYTASTTTPYVSYPSMNKRNDYVLLPKRYQLDSVQVSGDTLSDHRALTVDISL